MPNNDELVARLARLETCMQTLHADVQQLRILVEQLHKDAITREAAAVERDRLLRVGTKFVGILLSILVALGTVAVWLAERAEYVRALIVGPNK